LAAIDKGQYWRGLRVTFVPKRPPILALNAPTLRQSQYLTPITSAVKIPAAKQQRKKMNTKASCASLIAGAIAATLPGGAHAVHLNPQGTGQVLIYPYYTVRGPSADTAFNTLLSITNGSTQTKALKVRALEGRAGAQVMDFNLYLSPNDTWVAAIVPSTDGTRILTNDNSCVIPGDLFTTAGKNDFYNRQFLNDTGPTVLDRTREGYVEVIEMGVVTDATATAHIRQTAVGVPANCAALNSFDTATTTATSFPAGLSAPTGGLSGRGIVLNSALGASYGYDATALDAWSATVQYTPTGAIEPLLGRANPPVSNLMTGEGNVAATWQNGTDAVSAALMRSGFANEYLLDASTQSKTDWIVMFPTKREYVRSGTGAAAPPFAANFNFPVGSCDPFILVPFNRESGALSSFPASSLPASSACWTVTTIPFASSGSHLAAAFTTLLLPSVATFANGSTTTAGPATSLPGPQGPNGVARVAFTSTPQVQVLTPLSSTLNGTPTPFPRRHIGLPLISLSFSNFNNRGVTSLYGVVTPAKYEVRTQQ
jgi:hypothetical protein